MNERKLTRRSMLRGAVLLATGTLAAGVIQVKPALAQQKMSKADAKYQDTPKDGQKCANCVYFQKPSKCAVVEGDVSAEGWSILFNKKG